LKPFEKFAGFFHNRQIRCELGIKDIIKSQFAKGGNHLTFHIQAGFQTEGLSNGSTNRGGKLDHLDQIGIVEFLEEFLGVILLEKGGGRADIDALSAG